MCYNIRNGYYTAGKFLCLGHERRRHERSVRDNFRRRIFADGRYKGGGVHHRLRPRVQLREAQRHCPRPAARRLRLIHGRAPRGRGGRTPAAGKGRHGHDARGAPRARAGLYAHQPLLRARRAARSPAGKPPGRILRVGARSAGAAVQPRLRGVHLLRRERPHPGALRLLAVGAVAFR